MVEPGDFVLAAGGEVPVGRVESVLPTSKGAQLLIARAYSRGGYVLADAASIGSSVEDHQHGVHWHTLSQTPEEVVRRGVFRREYGRLRPDPIPMPYGAPRSDDAAKADVLQALAEEPSTRDGEILVRVVRGVALLDGWLETVGSKVVAERLARTTPGIWEAVNRTVSDEELNDAVRSILRRNQSAAKIVSDVTVSLGQVRVTLLPGGSNPDGLVERCCERVQGVRSVEIVA